MFIESNDIHYRCRSCGTEQTSDDIRKSEAEAAITAAPQGTKAAAKSKSTENVVPPACILDTTIRERGAASSQVISQIDRYTLNDPTLPHDTSGAIKCPNASCPSNLGEISRDVIYIKYDTIDLRFLYVCIRCDTQWKTSE